MNDRQAAVLELLEKNHGMVTSVIGRRLAFAGLVKRSASRRGNDSLAASAVLNAMERRGLVRSFRGGQGQWSVRCWAITQTGRDALNEREPAGAVPG